MARASAPPRNRFHVTPNFAITPDLQVIVKPSLNPNLNTLWVAGVRARITLAELESLR
jgi:carbohydrate-selective porin OprB